MSTPNITPSDPDPMPASPFTIADAESASRYIETSLSSASKSLANTRIVASVLLVIVLAETIWITSGVTKYLQPAVAAQVADGTIAQKLDDSSDDIRDSIAQKIPVLISQIPDQAIQQMPHFRQSLEDHFTTDLQGYAQTASKNLDDNLDSYLTSHQDDVKQAITGGKDSTAVHEIGNGITENMLDTLKTTNDGGETLQGKLDASLVSMNQVKMQMDRLADGKNLTPQEKSTRHMIAIMVHSVNSHAPAVNVTQSVADAQDKVSTNL